MPGANCQSRANDDKCLSMQIAAAAQCAAEKEQEKEKKNAEGLIRESFCAQI